ncbi:hypothetical protein LOK49_LG10G02306 [Camellia lanceoleosa]|uniref:Uncharacterized protein n=1 Tax=Camellia lanceoleosa TaxID=1840588 RepID=A0ACC0GCG7_9ERIC|nr:hypothetical protein LOK49_LG10G02306 [Camellia lanceoleosa]
MKKEESSGEGRTKLRRKQSSPPSPGARDLARPPTITDIYHSAMEKAKNREEEAEEAKEEEEESEEGKRLAISMATKATSLARELKSIKSDFCFMQERCALLEEENQRLHDGFAKGIRPEEDDLVLILQDSVEEKDDKITRSKQELQQRSIVEEEKTEVASDKKDGDIDGGMLCPEAETES